MTIGQLLLHRDAEGERAAFAFAGAHGDVAAVVGGDVADDRQAEAGAAGVAAAGPVDAVEALEDAVEVAGRNADALVVHRDLHRPSSTTRQRRARRRRGCCT